MRFKVSSIHVVSLTLMMSVVSEAHAGPKQAPETIAALIREAGNADDDQVRSAVLKRMQMHPDLEDSLKGELDRLVEEVDRWIHSKKLSYYYTKFYREGGWDFGVSEASPLYPLTCLYRGRMLAWTAMTYRGIKQNPERRRAVFDQARRCFEETVEAFPENRIARMYLGEPIPPHKHYHAVPGAPPWAVYQREGLERLTDVIEWWIDNRMQANCEYGGGWGDDCEMWRWWVPVLIGFDSPKINDAQVRFSEALMSQPHMRQGYMNQSKDVEHSAEDSADAITPMMHLDPDDEVWRDRTLRLAELMETLWTGRNERGFLQFKSTYFTAQKVDSKPARACDSVYHPRAIQPALLYWQRTRNERLTALFADWMKTWVDAAAREERGKPAGILPSAIHWPDGKVGGLGRNWWKPENYGDSTLYDWPGAINLMTHTLLLTWHITGDDKYLQPIRSMAGIRLEYLKAPPSTVPEPGTKAWCASYMSFLSGVMAKYRCLSGETEFDELLAKDPLPYVHFRMTGQREPLILALRNHAEAFRTNFEGYTSEVRYTDDILEFSKFFWPNTMYPDAITTFHKPNPALLYVTATGDVGDVGYFPLNAVRWLTSPREIAALAVDSGKDRLSAELFQFGTQSRAMGAEFYLLAPGRYRLTLTADGTGREETITAKELTVEGPRTRVSFQLPPRRLCVLRVRAQ